MDSQLGKMQLSQVDQGIHNIVQHLKLSKYSYTRFDSIVKKTKFDESEIPGFFRYISAFHNINQHFNFRQICIQISDH
uniref:SFRICE_016842 n=1 Tax=Spodoptera frugiperda TaxID=7108 RepID=A0A2H1V1P0_SPOFR